MHVYSTENTKIKIDSIWLFKTYFSFCYVVQLLNHVWLSVTPWTTAHQASPSFAISQSLLKLMSIESVMPSNHLILCHHLLLSSLFPRVRIFYNVSSSHHVAKVLELQLQHCATEILKTKQSRTWINFRQTLLIKCNVSTTFISCLYYF